VFAHAFLELPLFNVPSIVHPYKNDFVTSSTAQEAYNAAGRNLAGVRGTLLGGWHAQFAS
jgi:hypothetical protein